MNRLTTIRALVLVQLFLFALSMALDLSGAYEMQGALGEARAAVAAGEGFDGQVLYVLALLPLSLGALVAVWFDKRWGRVLYTLVTVMLLLAISPMVNAPVENLLYEVMMKLDGMLLAALWLPRGEPQVVRVKPEAQPVPQREPILG